MSQTRQDANNLFGGFDQDGCISNCNRRPFPPANVSYLKDDGDEAQRNTNPSHELDLQKMRRHGDEMVPC